MATIFPLYDAVNRLCDAVEALATVHDENAKSLITIGLTVNYLLKKAKVTHEEINSYFQEVAKSKLAGMPTGPEQAGTAPDGTGHGPGISSEKDDRATPGATNGESPDRQNENSDSTAIDGEAQTGS
jgi:hypothetical protein